MSVPVTRSRDDVAQEVRELRVILLQGILRGEVPRVRVRLQELWSSEGSDEGKGEWELWGSGGCEDNARDARYDEGMEIGIAEPMEDDEAVQVGRIRTGRVMSTMENANDEASNKEPTKERFTNAAREMSSGRVGETPEGTTTQPTKGKVHGRPRFQPTFFESGDADDEDSSAQGKYAASMKFEADGKAPKRESTENLLELQEHNSLDMKAASDFERNNGNASGDLKFDKVVDSRNDINASSNFEPDKVVACRNDINAFNNFKPDKVVASRNEINASSNFKPDKVVASRNDINASSNFKPDKVGDSQNDINASSELESDKVVDSRNEPRDSPSESSNISIEEQVVSDGRVVEVSDIPVLARLDSSNTVHRLDQENVDSVAPKLPERKASVNLRPVEQIVDPITSNTDAAQKSKNSDAHEGSSSSTCDGSGDVDFIVDNRKSQVCHHFSRGNCRFGDECRFLHTLTAQSRQPRKRRPDHCIYFSRGHCEFGTHCRYLHENPVDDREVSVGPKASDEDLNLNREAMGKLPKGDNASRQRAELEKERDSSGEIRLSRSARAELRKRASDLQDSSYLRKRQNSSECNSSELCPPGKMEEVLIVAKEEDSLIPSTNGEAADGISGELSTMREENQHPSSMAASVLVRSRLSPSARPSSSPGLRPSSSPDVRPSSSPGVRPSSSPFDLPKQSAGSSRLELTTHLHRSIKQAIRGWPGTEYHVLYLLSTLF
eukprot:CAMPEP_0184688634 /NCGR_PEP_ID=MMETSP0312-20130426/30209_1 /TAXON_ID=31354 /ORGANISM="Compsopogon coeruleus, Strain SAG 36.94" /LENGTH=723 /DNA_ID=CAMNT_0027145891 /DNA_START=1215 /DNA_END=3386 /DNA_ORIENTATION=-